MGCEFNAVLKLARCIVGEAVCRGEAGCHGGGGGKTPREGVR